MTTPTAPLGEVALKLQDGPFGSNLKSAHYVDAGVRVVRLQNVGQGHFVDTDKAYISEQHFESLRKHECRAGDILLATLGDPILRAARLPATVPVALNKADCLQLRPDPDRVDAGYLVHFLNSAPAQTRASAMAHGQTRPRVNLSQLRDLPVPVPPIEEQRRIAAILDAADALRSKRRQALAKLGTLTQSIFVDMFGDPALNAEGWDEVPIEDLSDGKDGIKCGPFGTQLAQREYVSEGVPLWGIPHVNRGFTTETHEFLTPAKAEALASFSIKPGDIVMTRKGTVGNCSIYPTDAPMGIMHSDLLRLRLGTQADPLFIAEQLTHSRAVIEQIRVMSGGAIMPGINVTKLKELRILSPPLSSQQAFAAAARAVADERRRGQRSAVAFETLFASLQQRAFAGEL